MTGVVTAKGDNWIEVKADGEEKARTLRSALEGRPAEGRRRAGQGDGREDQGHAAQEPREARLGVRGARPRGEDRGAQEARRRRTHPRRSQRSGTISGEIKSKKEQDNNIVIEVLAPGEEKARSYFVQYDPKIKGPIPEVLKAVGAAKVGDQVEFDWEATGHGPAIVKFEVSKTVVEEVIEAQPIVDCYLVRQGDLLAGDLGHESCFSRGSRPSARSRRRRRRSRAKLDPAKHGWHTDYAAAKAEAKRTGKPIFLVFRCEP